MEHEFTGRITFANGQPAGQVRVRVYDRDAPGKGDDDLTVQEGVSDDQGAFKIRFSPSKYLDHRELSVKLPHALPFGWADETVTRRLPDLTDLYQPYLLFQYTIRGQERSHVVPVRPFKRQFRLPESPPTPFRPSEHGLKFVNRFKGYFIPFSVPALPDIPSVSNIYGMCGGMVAAALDFAQLGRPAPTTAKVPKRKSSLHRYLYRRQIDSFGAFGEQIVRFARWMLLPDDSPQGVWKKSYDQFKEIRERLDDQNPLPIGLVYVSARDTLEIWRNHQVLATHYRQPNQDTIEMFIYDPNYPLRDDVFIRSQRVVIPAGDGETPLNGLVSEQWAGDTQVRPVRGFFAMPYVPVTPPEELD